MADNTISGIVTDIITDGPDKRIVFMPDDGRQSMSIPIANLDTTKIQNHQHITLEITNSNTNQPVSYDSVLQANDNPSFAQDAFDADQNAMQAMDNPPKVPNSDSDENESYGDDLGDFVDSGKNKGLLNEDPVAEMDGQTDPNMQNSEQTQAKQAKTKKKPKSEASRAKMDHVWLGLFAVLAGAAEGVFGYINRGRFCAAASALMMFVAVYALMTFVRTKKHGHKTAVLALLLMFCGLAGFAINIPVGASIYAVYGRYAMAGVVALLGLIDAIKRASIGNGSADDAGKTKKDKKRKNKKNKKNKKNQGTQQAQPQLTV